jgi:GNAT superfamily N-acetyltransferase
MGIERFGVEDGRRADACYEIFRASRMADDPEVPVMPRRVFLGWLQAGFMGEPRETWLLEDAAGVGGWYLLELPDRDNGHLSFLEIQVAPGRRRHGLGTALLRHAAGRAIADGRRLLSGFAYAGSAGEAFARASGAAAGQNEIRRVLDTGALSPERLASLREAALVASAGYSLVSWAGTDARGAPGPYGPRSTARAKTRRTMRAMRNCCGTGRGSAPPTSGRSCTACWRTR